MVTDNKNIIEQFEKKTLKSMRKTHSDVKIYGKDYSDLDDWELVLLKTDMSIAVLSSIGETRPSSQLSARISLLYNKRYEYLFEKLNKPLLDNVIEFEEENGVYSIQSNLDTIDHLYSVLSKTISNKMNSLNLHNYPLSLN